MVTENEDREERREPEEDGEAPVTVDVSEDNDDKEEDAEPEAAAKPERKTRQEKKQDRLRLRDEHERLKGEHQGLTAKVAQLENALRQTMASNRQEVRQRDDRSDPNEAALDQVYTEQRRLSAQVEALGSKITPEQVAELTKEYQRLDTRKHRLIAEQVQRQHGARGDSTADRYRQGLEIMFPDVYGNESAREWAGGYYRMERAKGRKDGPELVREALEAARREVLKVRPEPSQAERARFSGVARGGGGSEKKAVTTVSLSKSQRKMADTAYSHVKDKNVRYQMWAKKAGKRLAEKRS